MFAHAQHTRLQQSSLPDILRLIRTPGIGPVTFFSLIRRFHSAAAALDALPELSRRGGRRTPLHPISPAEAQKEIESTQKAGAFFVVYGAPDYPALLLPLADAPPLLTVSGNPALWQRDAIAVVGARNASAHGCQFAHILARRLGESHLSVVSGLARGIDAFAHRGALATGTVGVIAGGIDTVYPPENASLYAQLREHGAIISEQPLGRQPFAASFPGRNRIIAGLCLGTVVVEAAPRSGSLITAGFARDYNREVFAVPGSPLDPRARGCNQLLRDGAHLLESADDVLHALNPLRHCRQMEEPAAAYIPAEPSAPPDPADTARTRLQLIDKLAATAVSVDELIEQCETSAQTVLTILLELELAGKLRRSAGNKVSLTPSMEENA